MAKRLLCLALILGLFLSVPIAHATDGGTLTAGEDNRVAEPVYITVWNGAYETLPVYRYGEDLLCEAGKLAKLTAYSYALVDNALVFTRGAKTVTAHLSGNYLTVLDREQGILLNSPILDMDGQYYVSMSSMLPWLNVRCSIQGTVLCITPAAVSYWDTCDTFKLGDYQPTLSQYAEIMGLDTKDVKALAHTEKSFTGKIVDFCSFSDVSQWDTFQYEEVFNDLFLDQSATDQTGRIAKEQLETISGLMDCPIFTHDWPDGFSDVADGILTAGKIILEYQNYYYLFSEDNSAKIGMMEAIIDSPYTKDIKPMVNAARTTKVSYEKLWAGTLNTFAHELNRLSYNAIEEITTFDLLKQFKINYLNGLPENTLMKRFGFFDELKDVGISGFKAGPKSYTEADLKTYESYVMLNLYANEQRTWAMAQHIIDSRGTYTQLQEMRILASGIEKQYAYFTVMRAFAELDDCDYDTKSARANNYMANFVRLKQTPAPTGISALAEQSIYLDVLRDMDLSELYWDCLDLDGDGTQELVAASYFNKDFPDDEVLLVMDNSQIFTPFGVHSDYIISASGTYPYLRKGDISVGGGAFAEEYSCWTGSQWQNLAGRTEYTDWSAGGVTTVTYTLSDREVTQTEYDSFISTLKPGNTLTFRNPDLSDRTVSGDPAGLLDTLDSHFDRRDGILFTLKEDLDGNGTQDRLYGIFAAGEFYKDMIHSEMENMVHRTHNDRSLTLVAALSGDGNVHLQVGSVYLPYSTATLTTPVVRLDGQYLTVAGQSYVYNPQGVPYTTVLPATDPIAAAFLGKNIYEADKDLEDPNVWMTQGSGVITGKYRDHAIKLSTKPISWDQFEYDSATAEVSFDLVHEAACNLPIMIYPDMPSLDFSRDIYPASSLTPMVKVADVDGSMLWYVECYVYHMFADRFYKVEAYFSTLEEDRPLQFADAFLLDDLTEADRRELFEKVGIQY